MDDHGERPLPCEVRVQTGRSWITVIVETVVYLEAGPTRAAGFKFLPRLTQAGRVSLTNAMTGRTVAPCRRVLAYGKLHPQGISQMVGVEESKPSFVVCTSEHCSPSQSS